MKTKKIMLPELLYSKPGCQAGHWERRYWLCSHQFQLPELLLLTATVIITLHTSIHAEGQHNICSVRLRYARPRIAYQSLVECNLGHRILCSELRFFINNVINHSVINHSIILVYACPQLELQIGEVLIDLEKCIIEQLLMSGCKSWYEISDWRVDIWPNESSGACSP